MNIPRLRDIGDSRAVYVRYSKSGFNSSGKRNIVATVITMLSLGYRGRKVINSITSNRIRARGE